MQLRQSRHLSANGGNGGDPAHSLQNCVKILGSRIGADKTMDGGTSRRGAGLLAAGFALGVILPRLVGALRSKSSEGSASPGDSKKSSSDKSSTHAVREASSSSVRLPADDLRGLLGRIFVSAGCPP